MGTIFTKKDRAKSHTADCCCAVCTGLDCLERPRFFSGQLLTESDLNDAQGWAIAKQRLHNRYLHGPGVVCGLEVTCGDCEGTVNIAPGYAIDPCGNDIIVCEGEPFNINKAIQDCCAAARRKPRDCDPWEPPRIEGCDEEEQEWCITIRYEEKETRAVATLAREKSDCGCGCGGGGGKGCSCKGAQHNGNGKTSRCATPPVSTCEPTRIRESYRLGIVEHPEACEPDLKDTLFGRILECFRILLAIYKRRLPGERGQVAVEGGFLKGQNAAAAQLDLSKLCCDLKKVAVEMYGAHGQVRCGIGKTLSSINCAERAEGEDAAAFTKRIQESLQALFGIIIQLLIDCVCHHILPPCPPPVCDDRLILACVIMRKGKVLRICNLSCRQFAGSFRSLYYWTSAVPLGFYLRKLLTKICCSEDFVFARSPLVNRFSEALRTFDPAGNIRSAILENKFALPKQYADMFTGMVEGILGDIGGAIPAKDAVNLGALRNIDTDTAIKSLEANRFTHETREISSKREMASLRNLIASPFAQRGDHVTLYTRNGKVAGAVRGQRLNARPNETHNDTHNDTHNMRAAPEDVAAMREEMKSIRAELEKLRRTKGGGK